MPEERRCSLTCPGLPFYYIEDVFGEGEDLNLCWPHAAYWRVNFGGEGMKKYFFSIHGGPWKENENDVG